MAMRCNAILQSGRNCEREAEEGAEICSYHRLIAHKRELRDFYSLEKLAEEDVAFVATDLGLEDLDAEIAVMRVLIRRMVGSGDYERAMRGIETLLQTLKAADRLDRGSTSQMSVILEQALDE